MVDINKNPPWFRTASQCRVSRLPVTHPATYVSAHPGSNYFVDMAKLGDRIFLVKASGYVRHYEILESMRFMTDYLEAHFEQKTGLIYLEDYADVEGADSKARKAYIRYFKSHDAFWGWIVYHLPMLYRISFKIAQRLHAAGRHMYGVSSFAQAVALAEEVIRQCNAGNLECQGIDSGKNLEPLKRPDASQTVFMRAAGMFRDFTEKFTRRYREKITRQYAEAVLNYIESIDWQQDGIDVAPINSQTEPAVRKVFDAVSYIKSEIDDLMKARDASERVLRESEARLISYQAKLKELSIRLSTSEENQRRQLASRLHESVSQELFVAQLKLNALEKSLDGSAHLKQIDEIREQVVKSIREIKAITYDLSPPVLYDLGLKEAVESLAKSIEAKHRLRVKARFSGSIEQLDDEFKVVIYRVLKEITHNAIKHARAEWINIIVDSSNGHLNVDVSDNGVGFDTRTLSEGQYPADGFGLFDIREKITHLGGRLTIHSSPGSGTRVGVSVPIKEAPLVALTK